MIRAFMTSALPASKAICRPGVDHNPVAAQELSKGMADSGTGLGRWQRVLSVVSASRLMRPGRDGGRSPLLRQQGRTNGVEEGEQPSRGEQVAHLFSDALVDVRGLAEPSRPL